MAPENLPALRCESRLHRPEPRWGLVIAVVVLAASTLDALWMIPAQRAAAALRADRFGPSYRCVDLVPVLDGVAQPADSPTAGLRVERVYLLDAPAR